MNDITNTINNLIQAEQGLERFINEHMELPEDEMTLLVQTHHAIAGEADLLSNYVRFKNAEDIKDRGTTEEITRSFS